MYDTQVCIELVVSNRISEVEQLEICYSMEVKFDMMQPHTQSHQRLATMFVIFRSLNWQVQLYTISGGSTL